MYRPRITEQNHTTTPKNCVPLQKQQQKNPLAGHWGLVNRKRVIVHLKYMSRAAFCSATKSGTGNNNPSLHGNGLFVMKPTQEWRQFGSHVIRHAVIPAHKSCLYPLQRLSSLGFKHKPLREQEEVGGFAEGFDGGERRWDQTVEIRYAKIMVKTTWKAAWMFITQFYFKHQLLTMILKRHLNAKLRWREVWWKIRKFSMKSHTMRLQ